MINLKDKNIAVLGFGLEGRDLVKFLLTKGAKITIFDQKEEEDLDFTGIQKKKVNLVNGQKYLLKGLSEYDIVYRSPGVYRFLPEIVHAERKGVEVSSAIKLFLELCPAKVIGVTGTKGKGTTATLIYKILKASGKNVYLAGNIGKPYLELLSKLNKNSWIILELSSFQLIDITKSPHIAVVLNITTDHLDWHKDRKEYVEAKTNIVKFQKESNFSVLNYDYRDSKNFSKLTNAKIHYFSKDKKVNGAYINDDRVFLSVEDSNYKIGDVKDLKLRGQHNWENIAAATCVAKLAGADVASIKKIVFSFTGLEHRLELVDIVGGIGFYNDSFSTNSQTTIAAIRSFTEPITLILGGFDKGLEYGELAEEILKAKNVRTVVLIGDIAGKIKKALDRAKYDGKILELGESSMRKIVKTSFKNTPKEGVVLLSPATSSFDMFENYKERGSQFKIVVHELKKIS
jgi:UDP-N-acetylmuramoylalanine--D-glutamate ligase